MSHVSDGDLHILLDGELDLLPTEDAGRIQDHLDGCAECRERLEVERALRSAASELVTLGTSGGTSDVEVPPFESILDRAGPAVDSGAGGGAADGPSRPTLFSPLALRWAATVVLALGTGWFLGRRPALLDPPMGDEMAGASAPAPEVAQEAREESFADSRSGDRIAEFRARSDPAVSSTAAPPPSVSTASSELLDAVVRSPVSSDTSLPAPAAEGSPAMLTEPGAGAVDVAAARAAPERSENALRLGEVVVEAAQPEPEADVLAAERAARRGVPAARRLIIPDLEVVSVEWTEVAPGIAGVRVIQRLAGDRGTVEVLHGGLTAASEGTRGAVPVTLLDSVSEGLQQIEAQAPDGGWILLRAAVPEDELRGLLERLR